MYISIQKKEDIPDGVLLKIRQVYTLRHYYTYMYLKNITTYIAHLLYNVVRTRALFMQCLAFNKRCETL